MELDCGTILGITVLVMVVSSILYMYTKSFLDKKKFKETTLHKFLQRPKWNELEVYKDDLKDEPKSYNPEQLVKPSQVINQNQLINCPKCESTQITANKQGFSIAKAAGGLLIPGGFLWGFYGKNKVLITCLNCGHQWKAGTNRN